MTGTRRNLHRRSFLAAAGGAALCATGAFAQRVPHHYSPGAVPKTLPPKATVDVIGDMSLALPGPIHTNLVLCMDASDSMVKDDDDEFDLESNFNRQVEGTAAALCSDRVGQTIERKGGIGIACLQFASAARQSVGWAYLENRADARKYAGMMRQRRRRIVSGVTDIQAGLVQSGILLAGSPFKAFNAVVDVSGDGSNTGGWDMVKAATYLLAAQHRARVNGLAICDKEPGLAQNFKDHLVTDAAMFDACEAPMGRVWKVDTMDDYTGIMTQKLMDEIAAGPQPGRG